MVASNKTFLYMPFNCQNDNINISVFLMLLSWDCGINSSHETEKTFWNHPVTLKMERELCKLIIQICFLKLV